MKLIETAKKIMTLVLIAAISFTTFIGVTKAAEQTISIGDITKISVNINNQAVAYKKTTDGKFLYCIERVKLNPKNVSASLIGEADSGLAYIIKNGYPSKSITGDADKDYYITQAAVWWYLDDTTGSTNLSNEFKTTGSDNYGMRSHVISLVSDAKKYASSMKEEASISIKTNNVKFTKSGDYYATDVINVTTNGNEYKVSLNGATSNTKVVGTDGNEKSTFGKDEGFIIQVPASELTNDLDITATVTSTKNVYKAYLYNPSNSDMQKVVLADLEKNETTANASLNLKLTAPAPEKKETKVSITKVDSENGTILSGAVMVIRDAAGNEVKRFTTTSTATVINDLPYGTYTLSEVSAPSGYQLSDEQIKFTLDENNTSYEIKFCNYKLISVPDTNTSSLLFTILGITIIGAGIAFVYKNGKKA